MLKKITGNTDSEELSRIEEILLNHDAIMDCAVVEVLDNIEGEILKAFIVLYSEYKGNISENDIIKWAKDELENECCPKRVRFINEIPKTSMGKTLKRKLKNM